MITTNIIEWSRFEDGWLAKTRYGFLFVISRFDSEVGVNCWFVLYNAGPHFSIETSRLLGSRHGYTSLGEAKFEAEQTIKLQRTSSPLESSAK
jgi:hypothetical protein